MVTLAISTWHANPKLLKEQIINYNAAFSGEIVHMININSDFSAKFWTEANSLGIDFQEFGNVYFTERPARTYYAGVAHAFFLAVQDAIRRKISFDYIYWHTASDLMVKPGMNRFIRKFDIGFAKTKGQLLEYEMDENGVELAVLPQMVDSAWKRSITKDRHVGAALRAMGASRLHKSRSEGCFFSRDVFFEIMYPLISNISIREMNSPENPYPIEEYMFAQCVEFFCERNAVRRTEHVIVTSKNEKQRASIEDIESILEIPNKFGIKRFESDISSPEREYIRKTLTLNN